MFCMLELSQKLLWEAVFQYFRKDVFTWSGQAGQRMGLSILKKIHHQIFCPSPPCVYYGGFEKVLVAPKDNTRRFIWHIQVTYLAGYNVICRTEELFPCVTPRCLQQLSQAISLHHFQGRPWHSHKLTWVVWEKNEGNTCAAGKQ